MLLDEPIIPALQPAQGFEKEHEPDDADAGTDKHAARGDVPCPRQEAGVKGVPVPEHLSQSVSYVERVTGQMSRRGRAY